ncbi:MAG: endolytic transglycosylase MltG [Alphaproteobacteria bacterium]|nr:endolytic transglycosylase MltG [Alphaproteobacteria bacterium]
MSEADEKGAPEKKADAGVTPPADPAAEKAETVASPNDTAAAPASPQSASAEGSAAPQGEAADIAPTPSAKPLAAPPAPESGSTPLARPVKPLAATPAPRWPSPPPPTAKPAEPPKAPVTPGADIASAAVKPAETSSVKPAEVPPPSRPSYAPPSSATPTTPSPFRANPPPKEEAPAAARIYAPPPKPAPAPAEPITPSPQPETAASPSAPAAEAPSVKPPPEAPATAPPTVAPAGASIFERRATPQSAKQVQRPQAAPAPPPKKRIKRREGTLSVASGFLSFVLVALVAGVFGLIAATHKLKEPGPLLADKVVYIPPRSDLLEIISQLQREGVIASPTLMQLGLLLEGKLGKLKPGEYGFKKNISLRDVINQIASGRQIMHSVTIPEGLTSEQIVQKLKEADLLVGDINDLPKEGALLPETYKFPRNYPRARLIAKMQEDQRKTLEAIWAKRAPDLPLRTPYELVTLASIVEKETGKSEERPHVAAVFLNRLRKGMRLQSDPTIIYGLVAGKATLGRPIMRAEIDKWTPYNTYAIDGLPPGPIANPGRASLEAAAHPAPTRDLYFVADGTGGHVFSESLDQHSRNVQNWRRLEKEKNDETIDRATPGVPAPATPKPEKRTQAPIGRLVNVAESHEDYPPGRTMAPDDGPTHRLGKFGYAEADFLLGGHGDRTQILTAEFVALRSARPFFTDETTQPRAQRLFDPSLLARRPPPPDEEEERLNPDMTTTTVSRQSPQAQPDAGSDMAAYPIPPAQRAEQKARAARLGLAAGSDELPGEPLAQRAAQEAAPPSEATALAPAGGRPLRPRAFDASEGTPLDPLRDKSWDLTSAKTVPSTADLR